MTVRVRSQAEAKVREAGQACVYNANGVVLSSRECQSVETEGCEG